MIANDSPFCPVSSFEKYLSVLSAMNEYLFQRPKSSRQEDESHLTPSGVLNNIQNHSVRATTITCIRQKWI